MAEEKAIRKRRKRKESYEVTKYDDSRGRKDGQKMKPYAILHYLLKQTDENHTLSASVISFLLKYNHGIPSERRSIYKDIQAINKYILALEEDCYEDEAEERLENDDTDSLKTIVYDPHRKGYYARQRHFDYNDIQILAQCICSAKFISSIQAKRLLKVICDLVSIYQAEDIEKSVFPVNNNTVDSKSVLYSISSINDAMSSNLNGSSHIPEKISFDYSEYTLDEISQTPILRSSGRKVVSPYQLLTKGGDIYLLAYEDSSDKMSIYKVSRISNVSLTGKARTGENIFNNLDLQAYHRSGFTSYGNTRQHVAIQFQNSHFDAVIERFGTEKARYSNVDDDSIVVNVDIDINPAFYNWLLGLGTGAKILKPDWAAEAFLKHIDKIKNAYNEKQ